MQEGSNPALGLLGFWMMMQLATVIAVLLGGIYALYCLGRAASGLDRLASAVEDLVNREKSQSADLSQSSFPSVAGGPAAANVTNTPPVRPEPFAPQMRPVPPVPPVPSPSVTASVNAAPATETGSADERQG